MTMYCILEKYDSNDRKISFTELFILDKNKHKDGFLV